jgi:hypothetical protein
MTQLADLWEPLLEFGRKSLGEVALGGGVETTLLS